MAKELKDALVGKVIRKIYMNEDNLFFVTDTELIVQDLMADCCSTSYFYDFIGAKKVIGRKVTNVEEIELDINNTDILEEKSSWGGIIMKDNKEEDELIEIYGIKITVEDEVYGELTGVFSFRNASNGYYGGWLNKTKITSLPQEGVIPENAIEIKDNFSF